MKAHLTIPSVIFSTLMFSALATGNSLLFLLGILTFLTVLFCLSGVLWASSTLHASTCADRETVYRGEKLTLQLRIRHSGWIPVAPVLLELNTMTGEGPREIRLKYLPGKTQTLRLPLLAAHVGVFSSGIKSCTVEDLLGLFQRKVITPDTEFTMKILPLTFHTEPLVMAPGESESEMMARAAEDLSAPSDLRSYQPGDAMKKIHWKLSLRKGELMVRKFEEPVLQEALILLDCTRLPSAGNPDDEADIRDAMLETAASLYSDQMRAGHTVRMPLSGKHPVDLDERIGIHIVMDYLIKLDFTSAGRFEQMLMMESRRLNKVGFVAVVSAGLNSAEVETMIRMHQMGPNYRLYLITFTPDDPVTLPLIRRLEHAGIETAYIVPERNVQ